MFWQWGAAELRGGGVTCTSPRKNIPLRPTGTLTQTQRHLPHVAAGTRHLTPTHLQARNRGCRHPFPPDYIPHIRGHLKERGKGILSCASETTTLPPLPATAVTEVGTSLDKEKKEGRNQKETPISLRKSCHAADDGQIRPPPRPRGRHAWSWGSCWEEQGAPSRPSFPLVTCFRCQRVPSPFSHEGGPA